MGFLFVILIFVIIIIIISSNKKKKKTLLYQSYAQKHGYGKLLFKTPAIHKAGHPYIFENQNVTILVFEKMVCLEHQNKIYNIDPTSITNCEVISEGKLVDKNLIYGKMNNHYAVNFELLILEYSINNIPIKVTFRSFELQFRMFGTAASTINKVRIENS